MKRFDGKNWKEYVHERVVPRFQQFGDIVLKRVLPAFDGINEEATVLERSRYKELAASLNEVPVDYLAEADEAMGGLAREEAMDYAVNLHSMRFSTLNLFSGALYHLSEQHLVDLRQEIVSHEENRSEVKPNVAIAWFKDTLGLDVKALPSWPVIDELRLVANVVKHAEGHSAEDLRSVRPELLVYPEYRVEEIRIGRSRIRTPLFGHELYVTSEDFSKYHKGSVEFWTELANALPKLTR